MSKLRVQSEQAVQVRTGLESGGLFETQGVQLEYLRTRVGSMVEFQPSALHTLLVVDSLGNFHALYIHVAIGWSWRALSLGSWRALSLERED
jgi:hypothetical protein